MNDETPQAVLTVRTLGGFELRSKDQIWPLQGWKRDKSLQLFQYLLTTKGGFRHREVIVEALWPELSGTAAERDFKVALNGLQQALKPMSAVSFVLRNGISYALDGKLVAVDITTFEEKIGLGNRVLPNNKKAAIALFREALVHYGGVFLPERSYEDWSTAIRERLHMFALSTMTKLGEMVLEENPTESLHLALRVLGFEKGWEDAYRLAMRAYLATGNRPMALKTYEKCADVLEELYDVEPLPQTTKLYVDIKQL